VGGVAGAVGDDDHHLTVAGVQTVIGPAQSGRIVLASGDLDCCTALDAAVLRGNQAAIGFFQIFPAMTVRETVGAGGGDGNNVHRQGSGEEGTVFIPDRPDVDLKVACCAVRPFTRSITLEEEEFHLRHLCHRGQCQGRHRDGE